MNTLGKSNIFLFYKKYTKCADGMKTDTYEGNSKQHSCFLNNLQN